MPGCEDDMTVMFDAVRCRVGSPFDRIVEESSALKSVLQQVCLVAPTDATDLRKAVHQRSTRRGRELPVRSTLPRDHTRIERFG